MIQPEWSSYKSLVNSSYTFYETCNISIMFCILPPFSKKQSLSFTFLFPFYTLIFIQKPLCKISLLCHPLRIRVKLLTQAPFKSNVKSLLIFVGRSIEIENRRFLNDATIWTMQPLMTSDRRPSYDPFTAEMEKMLASIKNAVVDKMLFQASHSNRNPWPLDYCRYNSWSPHYDARHHPGGHLGDRYYIIPR